MAKEKLEDLATDQLKEKAKGLKIYIGFFILLFCGLLYFLLRDYFNGEELDWSILTIAICTLGGPATLYPELKEILNALRARS